MDNIVLQENDSLIELSKASGLTTADITERVIYAMDEVFGLIGNQKEDCGKSVKQAADYHGVSVRDIAPEVFRRTNVFITDEIISFIEGLVFWGNAEKPCPECGCELNYEGDSADGYSWVNIDCSNSACDYATSDEPDWDTMPGGHNYSE